MDNLNKATEIIRHINGRFIKDLVLSNKPFGKYENLDAWRSSMLIIAMKKAFHTDLSEEEFFADIDLKNNRWTT